MILNCIVLDNFNCEIRDVLACVRLSSYEKFTVFILREFLEKVHEREDVVTGCGPISVGVILLQVIGVTYTCRRLEEK
jgi:hypothetical protein